MGLSVSRLGSILVLLCSCSGTDPAAAGSECASGDERKQRFGTDCTCCHEEFGVAGSVANGSGARIARIVVTGADGRSAEMAPNEFGNFFRHLPLKAPLRAQVFGTDGRVSSMQTTAPSGGCNTCHGVTVPLFGAP